MTDEQLKFHLETIKESKAIIEELSGQEQTNRNKLIIAYAIKEITDTKAKIREDGGVGIGQIERVKRSMKEEGEQKDEEHINKY